ncbi:FtsW/RodA/SpoVE family cell cycle protein [Solibacillus sp. CAU 1738]|uniref:FtsW/RodA/SpoVE family cell cycle protein n=1 Tax=Solibacillus sp. CAU 1738 TaxID=3140363 RepID=UPI0032604CD1
MTSRIEQFIQVVSSHIRSKEARQFVEVELKQHINHAVNANVNKGMSPIEAQEHAINDMGSPVSLGLSLNKVHKPKIDWLLIGIVVAIFIMSILPLLALDPTSYLDTSILFTNKVIYIALSVGILLTIMFFDFGKLQKYSYVLYGAGVLLLFLLQFSHTPVNGQPVLYIVGPIKIEALMAVPLFFIAWASFFSQKRFKFWQFVVLFCFSFLLFAIQSTLPTLFLYTVMVFVMFWQSQFSRKEKMWTTIGAGITTFTLCVFVIGSVIYGPIKEYQLNRLFAYFTPEKYADGAGYLYLQLQKVLANASWFGTNEPLQLPDAHTDLVFASLIQYYGYFIGAVLLIVLTLCIFRMVGISRSIRDPFGKQLITGGITIFGTQFLYNIGMTFGLVPITSISLPFISHGLMPTILSSFIVGIALSVYRRKSLLIT